MEPLTNGTHRIQNLETIINYWVLGNERGVNHNLQAVFYAWLLLKEWTDEQTRPDRTIRFALGNLRELVDKFEELGEDVRSIEEHLGDIE
jgi:hypothetical protein